MVRSRKVAAAPTERARRATRVGAEGAVVGAVGLTPGQRWSASRKRDVVLRLLRSESLAALSRELGVEVYRRERALSGLERGLKDRSREPVAEALDAAKRHIGAFDGERAVAGAPPGGRATPPFGDAEVTVMSVVTSASTGRCYGVQRVWQAWQRSHSAHYTRRTREQQRQEGQQAARRGLCPDPPGGPRADWPARRFELPHRGRPQPAGEGQFDHLAAELHRMSGSCLRYRRRVEPP